jgi:MSHA pilin protein MshA
MNRKGFTLIELILVIAILGILAISALPKFLDLSEEAELASRDGVVGAVRSGIAMYRANDMVTSGGVGSYPATLDGVADGAACTDCFGEVLTNGVDDPSWSRTNSTEYVFNDGVNIYTYTYDSTNGTFE